MNFTLPELEILLIAIEQYSPSYSDYNYDSDLDEVKEAKETAITKLKYAIIEKKENDK